MDKYAPTFRHPGSLRRATPREVAQEVHPDGGGVPGLEQRLHVGDFGVGQRGDVPKEGDAPVLDALADPDGGVGKKPQLCFALVLASIPFRCKAQGRRLRLKRGL